MLCPEIEKKNKAIQTKELELNKALASAEAERLRLETARKELEKVSLSVSNAFNVSYVFNAQGWELKHLNVLSTIKYERV
mgnify:CR=1 FL=1